MYEYFNKLLKMVSNSWVVGGWGYDGDGWTENAILTKKLILNREKSREKEISELRKIIHSC